MGWTIVGVVGATIFCLLVIFLLNTPESIMKRIVDGNDSDETENDNSEDEDKKNLEETSD